MSLLLTLPASAVPITIVSGISGGNTGTENILFASTNVAAKTIFGTFAGSGTDYTVEFFSTGGDLIAPSGGQARVAGVGMNSPFTHLTFQLLNNATFTKAILNPDATANGTLAFTVTYLPAGSPYVTSVDVNGNGSNFFTILAGDGAVIRSVTLISTNTSFADASQFRIGGFAPAPGESVPDSGATVALLGLGLTALGFVFRRRKI